MFFAEQTELVSSQGLSANVAAWRGIWFYMFDLRPAGLSLEWFIAYSDADSDKRLEMEASFVKSSANARRGWNATRRDIIEQFVKQLTV